VKLRSHKKETRMKRSEKQQTKWKTSAQAACSVVLLDRSFRKREFVRVSNYTEICDVQAQLSA
jgi:hypothetical protein